MSNPHLISASNGRAHDIRTALIDVSRLISIQLVMDEGLFVKIEKDTPGMAKHLVRKFMDFVSEHIDNNGYVLVEDFVELWELEEVEEEEDFQPLESLHWDGGCDDPECGCHNQFDPQLRHLFPFCYPALQQGE